MKKLKQIISEIKTLIAQPQGDKLDQLLWPLICYPPKTPLRLQQQQLLDEADKFTVTVYDGYFTHTHLQVNAFTWGAGKNKVLVSHGWGSKAADFNELISQLKEIPDVQVIAFDAPANGSSEGQLSNLLLFVQAIEAVVQKTGTPDVFIGHSLGGMANVIALNNLGIKPSLLISITPLILLKENFAQTMTGVGVPQDAQERFFTDFEARYNVSPSFFTLAGHYQFDDTVNHWLAYDEQDMVLPYNYLKGFLDQHPSIQTKNYPEAGHERIIKSTALMHDIATQVAGIVDN